MNLRTAFIRIAHENPETRSTLLPLVKQADKWETLPKGWTDESLKQFWDKITGDVKHKVTKCIKEMEGKFDDPGAFCASLADRVDPGWRSRTAAFPREGKATLRMLPNGFQVYYQQSFSPHGLAAEKMPQQGAKTRESLKKFVSRLGEGVGIPMSLAGESAYVLLGVENGSLTFNVEATVKVEGRKKLTRDMVAAMESAVFDRFGYQVDFL